MVVLKDGIVTMIPELWKNISQPKQSPVNKYQKINDHIYNKRRQVPLHHDPYLKTWKRISEHISIPIVETGGTTATKSSLQKKRKRKRIFVSVPVFKTETAQSESNRCR